jgi:hypothetical protein
VDRKTMLATEQKFRRQEELFTELLPEGEVGFGLDPSWVSIYPYQPILRRGADNRIQLRVRNYYRVPMKVEASLVAPVEWRVKPDRVKLDAAAGADAMVELTVSIPKGWQAPGPRFAIAADVVRDGRYLGQVTEAVAEVSD